METDFEITGRVFDLEPNKEVFNPNNDSIHQTHDSGEIIKEQMWTSVTLHSWDKGHEAREEGSKILEVGVESSTLNTHVHAQMNYFATA